MGTLSQSEPGGPVLEDIYRGGDDGNEKFVSRVCGVYVCMYVCTQTCVCVCVSVYVYLDVQFHRQLRSLKLTQILL